MTREEKALRQMKEILDAICSGKVTVVFNQDCFDPVNHLYGAKTILGLFSNLVHEGLGLDIPDLSKKWTESTQS